MKKRLLSAAVMIAVGLPCLILGGWILRIFLTFIAFCMACEITSIKFKENYIMTAGLFILIAGNLYTEFIPVWVLGIGLFVTIYSMMNSNYDQKDFFWILLTGLICSLALNYIFKFYYVHQYLLIYAAGASLICDAGAYFVGRKFGKHKMAPTISPKKTVEGAIGGIVIGTVAAFTFAVIVKIFSFEWYLVLALTFVLTVVSEVGDLYFSLVKRKYGIKDYGKLIPGHGGVLDRFDSVVFVVTVLGLILGL